MQFKTLYKTVFALTIILDSLDYAVTQIGLSRYPAWSEANPYVRLLMHYGLNPHLSSTIVFLTSLAFIFGAYYTLKGYLNSEPYCNSLTKVGKYLWNLSTINAKDLSIFACLALAIVLITQHAQGFISWLRLFMM
ncbi:MAG: hypothetical protein B9J98_00625 [Candidatus Terraquivivens tikiterensis]|uniref:DUF5658 domain-containing protein n=1 Tax=Candidatus Terraquivivens tikiterensis TaxID=1980982 RepID=A0A2R7YA13_9ARCH|nr:MAG: hypothetical protein B9J98_00625 [Candidatus Terraquivivens tikiterensis]